MLLEYSNMFPTIENPEGRLCCIRVQIIGIAVVLERDFDNVVCF